MYLKGMHYCVAEDLLSYELPSKITAEVSSGDLGVLSDIEDDQEAEHKNLENS